ncbi:helix-turn-helix domain-containing protein [uncultured Ruegeria sp.]|uniref:helix-turn-helix domain-containing protein n=1 Tax=uncultured Ruegeria sp. TaxID=259304 RepID=UPI002634A137|nr:helix-turn-helix domain-containing protein [uncultured Ruegeria sp.]
MTTNTEYFRPSEAKSVVGVSRATIYNWAKEGKITILKHGSMSFVRMSEIRKIIDPLGDHLGD